MGSGAAGRNITPAEPGWRSSLARRVDREFKGCAAEVRSARAFVETTLASWELDEVTDVAVLLTSELSTNAVRHAGTAFRVAVSFAPSELVVEVSDGSEALPVTRPKELRAEGGRGMQLVEGLARAWGAHRVGDGDTGKVVWFELDLPG
jgi:two-component sensor histidine kinase